MPLPSEPIPKPPCSTPLRKSTCLDDGEYKKLTMYLRELAARYLDLSKPYKAQDVEKLRLLHEEAIKQQPMFAHSYIDAWPIKRYLQKYLCGTVRQVKESAARNAQNTCRNKLMTTGIVPVSCKDRPISERRIDASKENHNSNLPSPPIQSHSAYTVLRRPLSPAEGLPSSSSHAGALNSSPPSASPSVPLSSPTPAYSFRAFMCSCTPNLERLIPAFGLSAGITTIAGFRMLLDWPEEYLLTLLKEDMLLSESECWDVCRAMANLRSSAK